MNKKIIIVGIAIIVASVIISSYQNSDADKSIPKVNVDFSSTEWNDEVTKILPRINQLDNQWIPLWSDSSSTYEQGEVPITNTRTIANNQIKSTSYSYQNPDVGTIQVLIWKGEWVKDWDHEQSVENVLDQVNAETEEIIPSSDLSKNCTLGYYNIYEKWETDKFDLLFSECSKEDYRIRVNLSEGKYNDKTVEAVISFSNQAINRIE